MKKILFIFNTADDFVSSRWPLVQAAVLAGYAVTVAMPNLEKIQTADFPQCQFYSLYLNRKSLNPICQWKTLLSLKKIIQTVKPDLIQAFRMKLVLYAAFLRRFLGVSALIGVFTGLGYLFTEKSLKVRLLQWFVKCAFKYLFAYPKTLLVFQNSEDRQEFIDQKILLLEQTTLILGSGIDLHRFNPLPEPVTEPPIVLMACRLQVDKGVKEYVAAAKQLLEQGVKARFWLVGDPDQGGMNSVSLEQLQAWQKSGWIEWYPSVSSQEMPVLIGQSHLVCLPSYREGLPRILMEAAACERALVTTEVPGCREVVEEGKNGLLVPVKDPDRLAEALKKLIQSPVLRKQMAQASRLRAERLFGVENITLQFVILYQQLLLKD